MNRPSDAWLGIGGFNAGKRSSAFSELMSEGKITPCRIDGMAEEVYFLSGDEALAQSVISGETGAKRLEFIAPLDNMLWDRKLIKALFGFDYKWEIYTPVTERKYGYYVLPVLYGNQFAGRIEMIADKKEKQLIVKNFWAESGFVKAKGYDRQLEKRLRGFSAFNGCGWVKV